MEEEAEQSSKITSLAEYWDIIVRRRSLLLTSLIVIGCLGVVLAFIAKPIYQAKARLLVDPQSNVNNSVDANNQLAGIFALTPAQDVPTQIEVLQSPRLLESVLKQVGPTSISVAQVGQTNIIEVTAESTNKEAAGNAPNILLKNYINNDLNQNVNEINSVKDFAAKQLRAAENRQTNIENKLRDFQLLYHISDMKAAHQNEASRQSQLTDSYQKTQTELQTTNIQIDYLRKQLATLSPTMINAIPSQNPRIATLQDKIGDLQIERIGDTQKSGATANDPKIISIDARIRSLQRELNNEPRIIETSTGSLNPAYVDAKTKLTQLINQKLVDAKLVASFHEQLVGAGNSALKIPKIEFIYDKLNQDHDFAVTQTKLFQDKIADLNLRAQAHHVSANIVVPSDIPTAPIRPNRLQSILFACIIGCVFGLFLVFFQEYMDDRINSSDETSRLLKTPALASIAAFASPEPKLLLQMTGTETAIAESYRLLRTNIYFAAIDSPIRILLVTSAASNEGKSTTAINLALAMAIDGRKVILLDCDLRRPSLHKYFGVLSTVGVTDVLLGHSSIEDALQRRPDLPDFAMLPAGTPPPNPSELLNSKAFRNLVEELKGMADIVIIDSSPVLVAADASILASQSDGVLFVVESGATKKAAAKRATEILRQAHSKIVGFVYNKVTKNASDEYDYHKYRYAEPTSLSTVGSSSLNLPLLKSLESDHDHNHLKHNA